MQARPGSGTGRGGGCTPLLSPGVCWGVIAESMCPGPRRGPGGSSWMMSTPGLPFVPRVWNSDHVLSLSVERHQSSLLPECEPGKPPRSAHGEPGLIKGALGGPHSLLDS